MHNDSGVLVVVGSLCLMITLVLAWCLVGVRSSSLVRKLFLSVPNLLKAHIDYLLMTGLLMVFYLLFAHFRLSVSPVILVAMSVGSLMNPLGFLALRSSQTFDKTYQPLRRPRGRTLTTIGYAGAAWSGGRAAVLTL